MIYFTILYFCYFYFLYIYVVFTITSMSLSVCYISRLKVYNVLLFVCFHTLTILIYIFIFKGVKILNLGWLTHHSVDIKHLSPLTAIGKKVCAFYIFLPFNIPICSRNHGR